MKCVSQKLHCLWWKIFDFMPNLMLGFSTTSKYS